jgi:hypothetical protein
VARSVSIEPLNSDEAGHTVGSAAAAMTCSAVQPSAEAASRPAGGICFRSCNTAGRSPSYWSPGRRGGAEAKREHLDGLMQGKSLPVIADPIRDGVEADIDVLRTVHPTLNKGKSPGETPVHTQLIISCHIIISSYQLIIS